MIATQVRLHDVRDAERLVDAAIRRTRLILTPDQVDEIKLEGLAIACRMAAREYEPHRAGYAHAGSFAGYASRYLPGRLISAFQQIYPEQRRDGSGQVSLEDHLKERAWQPVATVAQHVGGDVGGIDISRKPIDGYGTRPLTLDVIGARPTRDHVVGSTPAAMRDYAEMFFDAVYAFLEAERPDLSENLRKEWAAQCTRYGVAHYGPKLDIDPPLPKQTQPEIARTLGVSEKTVRNRARLLSKAMDRARNVG